MTTVQGKPATPSSLTDSDVQSVHRQDGRILGHFEQPANDSLTDPGVERISSALGMEARRLQVGSEAVEGVCEFHKLEDGFYLLVTNLQRRHAWASKVVGEDLVEFHYRLSGKLGLSGQWGELEVNELAFLLWYQPAGYDDVYERMDILDRRDISVGVYCTTDWLRRAFSDQAKGLPEVIARIIEDRESGLVYRVLPYHPDAPAVLDALVRQAPQRSMGLVQTKAKAVELVCLAMDALRRASVDPDAAKLRFSERDLANVVLARDILGEEFMSPPSLQKLARRVGLNVAKLPNGFKRLYGETLHEFIRRRRLEHARHLLSATELQIGQVAVEVGYRHHSTFTAAFTEHFGIPPKALVKSRQTYGRATPFEPEPEAGAGNPKK